MIESRLDDSPGFVPEVPLARLARTPWTNLDTRTRTLTIGDSKAGHDIPISVSAAICRALKIARDHADKSGLIFPGMRASGTS